MDIPDSKPPTDDLKPEVVDHAQSKDFFHSGSLLTSNILSEMKTVCNDTFLHSKETQLTGKDHVEDNHDSPGEVGDKQIFLSLNVDSHPLKRINAESGESERSYLRSSSNQEINTLTKNDKSNIYPFQPKPSTVRKILEMPSTFSQKAIEASEDSNYAPDDYEFKLSENKNGGLGLSENSDVNFVKMSDNSIALETKLSGDFNCSFETAVSDLGFCNLKSKSDCLGLSESPDVRFVKMASNTVAKENNLFDDSNCLFKSAVSHLNVFDFHSKSDIFNPECRSSQFRNERSQQNEHIPPISEQFYHQMDRPILKEDTQSEIKSASSLSRNIFDESCIVKEIGCFDKEKLNNSSISGYSYKTFSTHLTFSDALSEELKDYPDNMQTGINKSDEFKDDNNLTVRNQPINKKVDIYKKTGQFSNYRVLCADYNAQFGPKKFNSGVNKIISPSSIQNNNNADSDIPTSKLPGNILGGNFKKSPISSTFNSEIFPRRNYFQGNSGLNMFSSGTNLPEIKYNQWNRQDSKNSTMSNVLEHGIKRTNSKEGYQEFIPAHKLSKIESDVKGLCSISLFSAPTESVHSNEQVCADSNSNTNAPTLKKFPPPGTEENEIDLGAATISCIQEQPPVDFFNEITCFSNVESIQQNIQTPNEETEHTLQYERKDLAKENQWNLQDSKNSVVLNLPEHGTKRTNSKEDYQEFIPAHKLSKVESNVKGLCSTSLFSPSTESVNSNEQVQADSNSNTNALTLNKLSPPGTEVNQIELGAATITCIKELPLMDFSNEITGFSNASSIRRNIQSPSEETEDTLQDEREDVVVIAIKNPDVEILRSEITQNDEDEVIFIKSVSRDSKVEVVTTNSKENVHGAQEVGGKRKGRETDLDPSSDTKKEKNATGEVRKSKSSKKQRCDPENKEIIPLILSRPSRFSQKMVVADNNRESHTKEECTTIPKNESLSSTSPLTDDVKRVFELLRPGCPSGLSRCYSTDHLANTMRDDSITDNSVPKYRNEPQSRDHFEDISRRNPLLSLDTSALSDFSVSGITGTDVGESLSDVGGTPSGTPFIDPVQLPIPETETPQFGSNYTTSSREAKSKAKALIKEIVKPSTAGCKRKRV